MPVTRDDPEAIRRSLDGLRIQTSPHWSLTVAVEPQRLDEVEASLRRSWPRRLRGRARTVGVPAGASASDALDVALRQHAGASLALLFPGDVWAADTVALLGASLSPDAFVYADEDQLTNDGTYSAPCLKPDWSPAFLCSSGYVGRPIAVGSAVARALWDLEGADTHSLELSWARAAGAAAAQVRHVAEVLCHRTTPRLPPSPSGSARTVPTPTTVSIVIPFRDEPRFLRTCIDSVRTTTEPTIPVEFVLVDNGTTDAETCSLMERLSTGPDVRILRDERPFNWARLNNDGARLAGGDVLVFLNNDIEALHCGWLHALCATALESDVGAVGARLTYPDGRLQHCGIVVGLGGAAGHPLRGLKADTPGYLGMAVSRRECSAVTGACLATRREVFDELGGFDESLGVDLNDVDYCLRAGERGYRTLYEPGAVLVHHESPSRGTAGGTGDIVRFSERWKGYIAEGDPYLNRHLTRRDPSCGLAGAKEEDDWNTWYSSLTLR